MKLKKFSFLKFNKKKYALIILFLVLAFFFTFKLEYFVSAEETSTNEEELTSSVYEILDSIDFSELQNIADDLENLNIFDSSIKEKITQILNGEYFTNYSSVVSGILSLIFGDIREFLPILLSLVAIGMLSNILISMKSDGNKGASNTIHFVCFSVVIMIVLVAFRSVLKTTNETINLLLNQMQIIFPILITLLGSIGSLTSISIYNPLVAVLTSGVTFVFDKLLYPIFIVIFILTIIGNLTDTVKLDKFIGFLNSSFKWVIGIVFTIFTGFLSIQGISAGKYDSVSIKATKFAMKSYIPIIGSYISEGMDFFILGSVLVKNTIGLVGVMLIFVTILSPILNIVIFRLGLQLCSGILEMTGSNKMSNFLNSCHKILALPIVLILGIAFMYVITITLIMCTANIF